MPVFILTLHCGQFLPQTAPVISLCERTLLSLTHTHSFRPVLLSPSLPRPSGRAFLVVITLEVGGVSGEGCRQAEGRTNNVFVCPHSGTRDRLGWRQRTGPVGALRKQVCQRKDYTHPLFFYRCQGIVNTLKKADTPKNTGAGFLLTCMHSCRL